MRDTSRSIIQDMSSSPKREREAWVIVGERVKREEEESVGARACTLGRVGQVGRVGHDDSSWTYSLRSCNEEKDICWEILCSWDLLLLLLLLCVCYVANAREDNDCVSSLGVWFEKITIVQR